MSTKNTTPIFSRIKLYFQKDFKHDLIAGIVVGLIALPLAIAFAVASGASAEQGIYTSIIAGLVMGILSGSRYQISGPTGAFIVILLQIVNKFGIDGLFLAGCMAGIILFFMGIFRLGSIIKFIPYPVTVGFTSGIGLIIFSGQIKDFLGLHFEHRPSDFLETIELVVKGIGQGINTTSLVISVVTLVTFLIWKRYNSKIPPAPIALAAGIIASIVISTFFKETLPAPMSVGTIPAGIPQFHMLDFSFEKIKMLVPSAFTIAMLAAIESLLSAVVADGMTGTKHNSNRELISQGIGNIILPFFNGIPATGAIARTAANIKNGGRTRMASLIHAITLLLILLIGAQYAKYIPLAALGTILIMVAVSMAEIPHFMKLLKAPKPDAFVLVTTFLLTVFVDLSVAVGIGIVLASILFIKRMSSLSVKKILGDEQVIGTEGSKRMHQELQYEKRIRLYEITGPLFFGVASELEQRVQHARGEILILRFKHVTHMDATAMHALEILVTRALKKDGHVYFATLLPHIKTKLQNIGIIDKIGGSHYVTENTTEAIGRAKKQLLQKE